MLESVRVEKAVIGHAPKAVFDFVLDVANYQNLMPNVNCVRILEQSQAIRITHWDTEIEQAPLVWTERDTLLPDELRIEFDSIEGDFEVFRGRWEVVSPRRVGPLRVACELEYSIGIPVIEEIVGPILKEKIAENIETMLRGLVQGLRDAV